MLEGDAAAMAELREDGYVIHLPDGGVMAREDELRLHGRDDTRLDVLDVRNLDIAGRGRAADVRLDCRVEGLVAGERVAASQTMTFALRKSGGTWRAKRTTVRRRLPPERRPLARLLARLARIATAARRRARTQSFGTLAYLPYRPGEDLVLPRADRPESATLPVPPREFWQDYDDFIGSGAADTERMLEILGASGVELRPGDRILDLGCAAGRMIRHLAPLAETCEIWGADIDAERITWCARHLSPPFHFLTSTKVPHLPFEDRSFRLVYCGSVFTHIDDLAQAWLLELGRLLTPDGRLYVTIADEHTLARWEEPGARDWPLPNRVATSAARRRAGDAFDTFTVGRGHESLVFYRRAYFARLASSAFEVEAAVPEAYGLQTAMLLRRRQ